MITAIGGTRTDRLDLFAVREALKSPATRTVWLTIKRKTRSRNVTITLRDLIPTGRSDVRQ